MERTAHHTSPHRQAVRWLLALALLATLLAGTMATPVAAAGCTVSNTNDSGAGSLRACIASAGSGDTINITATGTITLASTLDIGTSLTITGPGASSLTISGNNAVRVIKVSNISPITVGISGVTIANGKADSGGGIRTYFSPTLTLTNVTVSGNSATDQFGTGAGISTGVGSTLTVTNSTISGNQATGQYGLGAGLAVFGPTTITGSTISSNSAASSGGGIANIDGTLTITNSTISGNTVSASTGIGGGIENFGTATITGSTISSNTGGYIGGGIYHNDGTLTVTNSTISGNSNSGNGAGLYNYGMATLRFTTVTGNISTDASTSYTGGLYSLSSGHDIALFASIVSGNLASGANKDCVAAGSGTITSQGYNVVGSGTGCPSNGTADATAASAAAVLNTTLANNGGTTKTHDLITGGPAIDRVPTANCATAGGVDQRGTARPVGAACDSGAYEGIGVAPSTVNLTLLTPGGGGVNRSPSGTGSGPIAYAPGTGVTLTPSAGMNQIFVGWIVDGVNKGWAPSLTITMNTAHTVQANFVTAATFGDVTAGRADYAAIINLASRGTIKGYTTGDYGVDEGVQRAQMAALIARAMPAGPGTPTNGYVSCASAGTWDCEDWGNEFTDQSGVPASLWRAAGTLKHYGVAFGYDGAACTARNTQSPCYAPTASVSYVETITFITRAMIAKGYWVAQPNAPQPYAGVPSVFATPVATYNYYTAGAGGVPAPPSNWNAGATRGWFARALWQALNTYWGADGNLPDGRPAGGNVP